MSFPRPAQLVETSLAAAPRLESGAKPSLEALPTFPASVVDGVLVEGAYLHMECNVHRIIDGLGENCLVIGQVVAAHVDEGSIRRPERDDGDLVGREPLLAFLAPGRYASVSETYAFPFHEGFSR